LFVIYFVVFYYYSDIINRLSGFLLPAKLFGVCDIQCIMMGSSAKYPGDSNVVKFPIIQSKMYYYLSLESIYIGNTYVLMDDIVPSGNIIIDSGTTLTYIPSSTLDGLIQTISPLVTLPTYQDTSGLFQLCYNVGGPLSSENLNDILPNLNLDFGNGAVVSLPPSNTFLAISESIVCLAILSSDGVGTSILGNIAQQKFLLPCWEA